MTSRNAKPLYVAADLEWCPRPVMHALVIVVLCCLPGAGLLAALWLTDISREPDNTITHHQDGEPRPDPDDTLAVAA